MHWAIVHSEEMRHGHGIVICTNHDIVNLNVKHCIQAMDSTFYSRNVIVSRCMNEDTSIDRVSTSAME